NRPEAANTINVETKNELMQVVREMARDDEARVLVITGTGRIFCGGGDFRPAQVRAKEVSVEKAEDMQPAYDDARKGNILPDVIELQLALQRLGKPTIAMVNGAAVGHGLDLALSCDMRTGSTQSRFSVGFTRMGLPPPTGGTWLLPRVVGMGKALELILTGAWIDAQEAHRIGLLNRLVPVDHLEEETMHLAGEIAAGPPIAQSLSKQLVYRGQDSNFESALAFATACSFIAAASEDHKEGIKALAEKRAPVFKGR
ncbi:MAG: enoyl-CoA hydratase/isomerase family protein, partial [Chloroflexi bacterium]|nr:enoyl-CoA hydratase/isomerase family protein [Chloroflexota bacterium]